VESGDYFSLNTVGTDIFNCTFTGMEIEAMVDFLVYRYDVGHDILKNDVITLV